MKCQYRTVTATAEAEGGQPDLACDRYQNVVEAEVISGLWSVGATVRVSFSKFSLSPQVPIVFRGSSSNAYALQRIALSRTHMKFFRGPGTTNYSGAEAFFRYTD